MSLSQQTSQEASILLLMRAFEQGGGELQLSAILQQLVALEAIDALCAIAKDTHISPTLRQEVLRALASFPRAATIALFLDELQASSRQRKQLAIEVLGRWRVHQAAPLLCKQLGRLKQTALRGDLLDALGHIATPDALYAIQQCLAEAPLSQLAVDLERLAMIPQLALLDAIANIRLRWVAAAEDDQARQTLLDGAMEQLKTTLQEHQRSQLKPYRQQLEEALFE